MPSLTVRLAISSALAIGCTTAFALPFNSFDPRSMAMGGAGVAVGDAGIAPLFNPALLAVTKDEDDFAMNLPIVGARMYDPEDFIDSLDAFQDGMYVEKLDDSINLFNTTQAPADLLSIANNTSTLSTEMKTIDNKPIQIETGAALVIGIPSKKFGGAFYANGWGGVEGVAHYVDDAKLQEFSGVLTQIAGCNNDPVCLNTLFTTNATVQQYASFNTATSQVTVDFDSNQLNSKVEMRAAIIGEAGFSFARQFGEGTGTWTLGVTPKLVKVNLYEYTADAGAADTGDINGDDYLAEYSHVNFDIGLAKNFNNGWRSGFVVKNVIGHSYDFMNTPKDANGVPIAGAEPVATGNSINIKPQARIGVSHQNSWSTVALDVDLTANDPVGMEEKSRYIALGGELNAWDWVQLRAGYRINTFDSNRNVASLGLGLAIAGTLHVDVAAAGNDKEVGASAQIGLQF